MLQENAESNGIRNVMIRQEAVAERSGRMGLEFPHWQLSLIGDRCFPGRGRTYLPLREFRWMIDIQRHHYPSDSLR